MSFAACGEAKNMEFATTQEAEVYTALVPPQRYTLKPPRQLQPEVVHRSIFQCLCAALPQIEMNRTANHRIERENYNKPKSEDAKQPQCPLEKERAIKEALKHFGMI